MQYAPREDKNTPGPTRLNSMYKLRRSVLQYAQPRDIQIAPGVLDDRAAASPEVEVGFIRTICVCEECLVDVRKMFNDLKDVIQKMYVFILTLIIKSY